MMMKRFSRGLHVSGSRFAGTIAALVFSLWLGACSSAPGQREEVTEKQNKAAEFAQSGNSYFTQGMYERALEFFNLALAYNGAVYNEPGIAQSYNSIGKVYLAQGYPDTATIYYQKAREMVANLDEPFILAQSINNLGELELTKSKYTEALKQFEQAFTLIQKAETKSSVGKDAKQQAVYQYEVGSTKAVILHNLGSCYKQFKETDKATMYLKQALAINLAKKKYEEVAANYYMLASLYSEKGDYENSKTHILQALAYDIKVENSLGIAKDYLALGLIYNRLDQTAEAYTYFKRSLFVYHSLANIYPNLVLEVEVKSLYSHLLKATEKLGKTEEAAELRKTLVGKKE